MRQYEVMVILDAGLEEDAIRTIVDRATQIITSRGGTVDKVDRWGKRRFAYEVHHRSEGYYVLIETTAEPPCSPRSTGCSDSQMKSSATR